MRRITVVFAFLVLTSYLFPAPVLSAPKDKSAVPAYMKEYDVDYGVVPLPKEPIEKKKRKKYKARKEDLPPIKMVFVDKGCFQMGDPTGDGDDDERPVHEVCVLPYFISETEVTQRLFKAVMGYNITHIHPNFRFEGSDNYVGLDKPVTFISFNEVIAFIEELNNVTGSYYRLPTEAEWEYAARSRGKDEKWPGINNEAELPDYAWFEVNADKMPQDVKTKKPNGLGIYDMAGNAREWINDNYEFDYYQRSPKDDPYGPETAPTKVVRGGTYLMDSRRLRTTFRYAVDPTEKSFLTGFRLAE